jgi:hypothetical protein
VNTIFANHTIEERDGFKARQLSAARTPAQVVFDVVFGILMPVFCFYFDPGIVRAGLSTPVGELSLFIYAFSGFAIIVLMVWLFFGDRMGSLRNQVRPARKGSSGLTKKSLVRK